MAASYSIRFWVHCADVAYEGDRDSTKVWRASCRPLKRKSSSAPRLCSLPNWVGWSASALSLSSCPPAYHRPSVDETIVPCLRVVSFFVGLLRLRSRYGPAGSLSRPRRPLSRGFGPAGSAGPAGIRIVAEVSA
jgi:hypothetical protein